MWIYEIVRKLSSLTRSRRNRASQLKSDNRAMFIASPTIILVGLYLFATLTLGLAALTMKGKIDTPAKCELLPVIRFLQFKVSTHIDIHRQLTDVYREKCMVIKNVRQWCKKFAEDRTRGRPSVSDKTEQIDDVSKSTIDKISTDI